MYVAQSVYRHYDRIVADMGVMSPDAICNAMWTAPMLPSAEMDPVGGDEKWSVLSLFGDEEKKHLKGTVAREGQYVLVLYTRPDGVLVEAEGLPGFTVCHAHKVGVDGNVEDLHRVIQHGQSFVHVIITDVPPHVVGNHDSTVDDIRSFFPSLRDGDEIWKQFLRIYRATRGAFLPAYRPPDTAILNFVLDAMPERLHSLSTFVAGMNALPPAPFDYISARPNTKIVSLSCKRIPGKKAPLSGPRRTL